MFLLHGFWRWDEIYEQETTEGDVDAIEPDDVELMAEILLEYWIDMVPFPVLVLI